jgi:hypothetical protein
MLLIYMSNPKLLVHKFAQGRESARKCEHEYPSNEGSILQIQSNVDFLKRIHVIHQNNSSIPKFSSWSTFTGPRLATGGISMVGLKRASTTKNNYSE